MADSVQVDLVATDKISPAANRAASSIEDVDGAARGVSTALEDVQGEARGAAKELDKVGDTEGGVSALSQSLASFAGNVLAKAAEKAAELGVELAKSLAVAIVDTAQATRSARNLLDVVTGGKAGDYFPGLQKLAKGLGRDANEVTQDFVAMRKEVGRDDVAVDLVRLRSDLEAIAPGAGLAEEATSKAIEAIKGGKDAKTVLADLAKQYGVVGDGSNAAAVSMHTVDGALGRIKAVGSDLLIKVVDKIGPKISDIAARFGTWLESPAAIEAVDQAIAAVDVALDSVIPAAQTAGEILVGAWEGAQPAIASVEHLIASIDAALGDVGVEMTATEAATMAVGSAFGMFAQTVDMVASAIDLAVAAYNAIGEAATAAGEGVKAAQEAVSAQVDAWKQAGSDLVQGFIDGVRAKMDEAIATVRAMGEEATATIKGILEIGSPSKVFEEIGGFVTEGFEAGLEPVDVGSALVGDTMPDMAGSVPFGGGAPQVNLTIQVDGTAAGGDPQLTAQLVAQAVRAELMRMYAGMGASGGLAGTTTGGR